MAFELHGELVPLGGGDAIPLVRERLVIGRRESCDICLRFPDVSQQHAALEFVGGYWWIRDLNSTNGIKVQGQRCMRKMLHPNDEVSVGRRRKFTIQYTLPVGQRAHEEIDDEEDVMGTSLLEKAGLAKPKEEDPEFPTRYRKGFDPADFLLGDNEDDEKDEAE